VAWVHMRALEVVVCMMGLLALACMFAWWAVGPYMKASVQESCMFVLEASDIEA